MDLSSVQPLLDWVSAHPHWAGVITMLIACGESLAMVGILVPGIALLWGVGTLVGLGVLDLFPILVWTAAGAFLGDVISYWLGRRYHEHLRSMWPLNKYPDLVPKGEAFFEKHGGKSVIMGRFLGPMRAVIPAVAGILNMPAGRFIAIDLFAAVIWAPPTILPGVAIGASLGIASEIASRLIVMLLVVIVSLAITIWFIRRVFGALQPRADALLERLVAWSKAHRITGMVVAAVVDPDKPESRGLIVLGGALLVAVWVFLVILNSVAGSGTLLYVDNNVAHFVHELRTPWTHELMRGFAALSDPIVIMLFSGVVTGWLFLGRYVLAGAHWLAALAYGLLMPVALHLVLALPSLEISGERIVADAFPSMNMTLTSVVFGFFAVMLSRELRPSWRWVPYAVGIMALFIVGLALIYLEMQTLSNVLGGLALGLAWSFFLGLAYRRHAEKHVSARGLAALALMVLAVGTGWRASQPERAPMDSALAEAPLREVEANRWRERTWAELPAFRMDWEGFGTQPLTVQYAGELDALRTQLERSEWRLPVPFTPASGALWLAPNPELSELPLLPQVHDGRFPALALVKATAEPHRMLVLRLWPAGRIVAGTRQKLWIGSVAYLDLKRRFDFFVYPQTPGEYDAPLQTFVAELEQARVVVERVRRTPETAGAVAGWNGDVLLVTAAVR